MFLNLGLRQENIGRISSTPSSACDIILCLLAAPATLLGWSRKRSVSRELFFALCQIILPARITLITTPEIVASRAPANVYLVFVTFTAIK